MTIKKWTYGLLPAHDRPKGYIRHLCDSLEDAFARVKPDGEWEAGAHIEVTYEGVGDDAGFKQSEFLSPEGWSQGLGQAAWDEQERLVGVAREIVAKVTSPF